VLARELFDRVVFGCRASDVAGFLVVIERHDARVVVVRCVVREVFGWWGMRVPLGSSFARDPVLLRCLLSYLLFSSLSILSHLSHLSSPSHLFSFPPFDLVLCEPFGLLANGILADRGEFFRGYS
jgi:hypothetical protein